MRGDCTMEHGVAQFVRQRETAQRLWQVAAQPDQVFLRVKVAIGAFWLIGAMERCDFQVEPARHRFERRAIIPPLWVTCAKTAQELPRHLSCLRLYALFHISTLFCCWCCQYCTMSMLLSCSSSCFQMW